jgi:DNA-binding PadR family transcriptional regulator
MIQDIEQFCGTRLEVGTLYGAIARLEKQGWIEALDVAERRRPYRLTEGGKTVLQKQLVTMSKVVATGSQRLATA